MRRPRFRPWRLVPLSFLLVPPLLWMLLLLIIPTDWARVRIEGAISQATGRTVHLESLQIGVLGGVRLTNLEIGAPGSAQDPWLKVGSASVNVTLLQLLFGQAEPTDARVDGIALRVLRRADGSLELADLIPSAPADARPTADSGEGHCALGGLEVGINKAHVLVIDEPSRTRLEFSDVEGRATWQHRRATIHELRGMLNGGAFELTAQLDGATAPPGFEGELRARGVALGEGMDVLGYLVPVVAGTSDRLEDKIDGRIDVNLYLRGQGLTRDAIRRSLVGHGAVGLDPIRLDGSKILAELANLVELPTRVRVGSVKTDFEIKRGRVRTEDLTVNVAKVPLVLAGWTDFDGRLDYRLTADGLSDRLPGKVRNLLAELAIDPKNPAALKVRGSLEALTVTIDGVPLNPSGSGSDLARRGEDRPRLRDLGRRLRDRILR
ncbi:MAG TPA: AsmA-like C-terminal region-containing protein [Isosphaeraceae bacterium]|nr:AsmA-like C-terminal region-containing protein [Isosphaeraceae bacterium]